MGWIFFGEGEDVVQDAVDAVPDDEECFRRIDVYVGGARLVGEADDGVHELLNGHLRQLLHALEVLGGRKRRFDRIRNQPFE